LTPLNLQGPTLKDQEGKTVSPSRQINNFVDDIDLYSYCLMPNLFHILLCEKTEGGIQKFMMKLSTAYSMYFNSKNKRTGALFESRFKAKHANTDEYLKYLFAYIHLNPVKLIDPLWKENGIQNRLAAQDYLADYVYSSYSDWRGGTRMESKIINRSTAPKYFKTSKDFNDFVDEWLTFNTE
jgi:putative transposase